MGKKRSLQKSLEAMDNLIAAFDGLIEVARQDMIDVYGEGTEEPESVWNRRFSRMFVERLLHEPGVKLDWDDAQDPIQMKSVAHLRILEAEKEAAERLADA